MPRRHPPIPDVWLMTDERMGGDLWGALARLPRGSGVVFRHYGVPTAQRRALFARIARIARTRRLLLLRAGPVRLARHEEGVHGARRARDHRLRTAPAHSRAEAVSEIRAGADALFVSPVFATRSHPGARTLGRVRLGLMVLGLDTPLIALGGMNADRARTMRGLGIRRWAAIDAWTREKQPRQKRKAVPT